MGISGQSLQSQAVSIGNQARVVRESSRTYLILLTKSISRRDLSEPVKINDVKSRDVIRTSVEVLLPVSANEKG